MSAAKVELGRHLFYDRRLSGNGTFSCASCHRQELAFTDGQPRAVGATGEVHPRSAMSLANVAYNATLNWADPAQRTLESQARVPMLNRDPVELGLAGRVEEAMARLAADRRYPAMFRAAFPRSASQAINLDNTVRAIAAFERTLISGRSAYDRWVFLDQREAMSDAARRGMGLFFAPQLGCSECHGSFNFSGPVDFVGAPEPHLAFHNTGLFNLGGRGLYPPRNRGLYEHTGRRKHMGRFRAPTLRNIALTAPYMHDGSIASLRQVLDHYAAGGRTLHAGPQAGEGHRNPYKSELLTGFRLTSAERADLIAFLGSLTDEDLLRDPRFSDPFGAR